MDENNRILILGREQEDMYEVTRLLETVGFIVTGTSDDGVALDLVGNSEYAALVIGGEVSLPSRRYVSTGARKVDPLIEVVVVEHPQSVLAQLRRAGVYK